jgi:hypothetical protein
MRPKASKYAAAERYVDVRPTVRASMCL